MNVSRAASSLVLATALLACGPSPAFQRDEPAPASADDWTPAPHDYATPFWLGQRWIGRMSCDRGELLFALHVAALDGSSVRVVVEVENETTGDKSVFDAHGAWDVATRAFDVTPARALELSGGESTFAMHGKVTVSERRMLGVVDARGCSAFSLRVVP
ncbi:MAG TPA: hypothetical protein VGM56_32000 [Byssovorax sp.]